MAITEVKEIKRRKAKGDAVALLTSEEMQRRRDEYMERVARRAYELYEQRGFLHGYHEQDWLQAERELGREQQVAWSHGSDGVRLFAEVPGVPPDRVVVSGADGAVWIEARHPADAPVAGLGHARVGRDIELFLPLPCGLAVKDGTVRVEHGLLEVFVPAQAATQPVAPASARKPSTARKSPAKSAGVRAAAARPAAKIAPAKSSTPKSKKSVPARPEAKE